MLLATSDMIREIDRYAITELGITEYELIGRAGEAVAAVVRKQVKKGSRIIIFAGKGNNGADGYATAISLMKDNDVCVYDVFSAGQRSEGGKRYLEEYKALGGVLYDLSIDSDLVERISLADCVIDAIFGTGFSGEIPNTLRELAKIINSIDTARKIAIDVPLGVNADNGSVNEGAVIAVNVTVSLSFIKPGLVSYPAKEYVGRLKNDNISLQNKAILSDFDFNHYLIDENLAYSIMPRREDNSNKGSFGKLLLITGSEDYPGAGALSLEAALRGGAGLVTYLGESEIAKTLYFRFPEAIYKRCSRFSEISRNEVDLVVSLSKAHGATLIGSGCTKSEGLYDLVCELLRSDGGLLIIDADAINVLAERREEASALIKKSKRTVILTPHPLEFARLIGSSAPDVQLNRLSYALNYAREHGCILVLKGAATIVTDGKKVFINSSGSSALAKAGSGDVLAGFLSSAVTSMPDPLEASAFSVYVHGAAGDALAARLSEIGVTPSDLPKEMAHTVADLSRKNSV